jgi:AcrR family transcriptional regulator
MRVDELARDVGISKRTLYEEFRTKEEMAREALVRLSDSLRDAIEQILREDRADADRLRAIVLHISQTFARARPPFYRDLETTPALTELVERCRHHCFAQVEEVVKSGIDRGSFRSHLEPRLVRRTLLAAVDNIVTPEVLASDRLSLEQAFDGIFDLILNGIFEPDSANC